MGYAIKTNRTAINISYNVFSNWVICTSAVLLRLVCVSSGIKWRNYDENWDSEFEKKETKI